MLKSFLGKLLAALVLLPLCACGAQDEMAGSPSAGSAKEAPLSIVCTAFPLYDWTRSLLGTRADGVELTYLLESGMDMHSYQPSADDMVKITSCDLFICVGGTSDTWVDDALRGAVNEDMAVLKLMETMDALGLALPVAPVKGMQELHEHDAHMGEYDEHIWMSPVCAAELVSAIGDALCAADAENAALYRENCGAYIQKLTALDEAFRAAVAEGTKEAVLVADRFPFRYLMSEYDIDCYAAFDACSAETEASFETIVFLARTVDELGISVLLTSESTDGAVARTIAGSTASKDQQILALDSMQSVTRARVDEGASYLALMEENLEVMRLALA